MKIVLIILVVLALAIVGGALLAGPQLRESLARFKPEPSKTTVRAETTRNDELVETVSAPGEIEPHTRVELRAEVSARILELAFREGNEVRKDDIICKLDDRDLNASLVRATAQRDGEQFRLRSDKARLAGLVSTMSFARKELERMQALFDSGDVSGREMENAMERVQDLEASLEATKYSISVVESSLAAAEAEIERARDGLNKTVIVAPMDGEITRLNIEVGEVVTGSTTNPGTVIMTIADRSRMIMKAQVAESDIANLEIGQRAKIFINAYPDDVFSGTVTIIALQRSGNPDGTGYFEAEVEIDLRGRRIRSGHVANADIEIETHEGVVVPYQAIVAREVDTLPESVRKSPLIDTTKSKASLVYRIVDGKTVCTPIKAGASDLTHRVVLEGLEEGEQIVTGPFKVLESIAHDQRVAVEGEDADGKEAGDEEAVAEADAEATDATPEDTVDDAAADAAPAGDDAPVTDG
ncbi:MAG: efflux RND transporter periplasmic adaptor subunit [Planctomycetes bacterium]|nr:efflux RND transporter periplasmic adaptor subunit [Planctomycetota bacterium]